MKCCDMKGFLSYLVLWIISKKSLTGAEIAEELGKRRGSKPSPGTIYPVLKDLTKKGLITPDNKKIYHITKTGEKELKCGCAAFARIFYDMKDMCKCSGKD